MLLRDLIVMVCRFDVVFGLTLFNLTLLANLRLETKADAPLLAGFATGFATVFSVTLGFVTLDFVTVDSCFNTVFLDLVSTPVGRT